MLTISVKYNFRNHLSKYVCSCETKIICFSRVSVNATFCNNHKYSNCSDINVYCAMMTDDKIIDHEELIGSQRKRSNTKTLQVA